MTFVSCSKWYEPTIKRFYFNMWFLVQLFFCQVDSSLVLIAQSLVIEASLKKNFGWVHQRKLGSGSGSRIPPGKVSLGPFRGKLSLTQTQTVFFWGRFWLSGSGGRNVIYEARFPAIVACGTKKVSHHPWSHEQRSCFSLGLPMGEFRIINKRNPFQNWKYVGNHFLRHDA